MKKVLVLLCLAPFSLLAQVPEKDELFKLISVTTTEMEAIVDPDAGSLVYNTTENEVFYFNGLSWIQQKPGSGIERSTAGQVKMNQDISLILVAGATATPVASNFQKVTFPDPSDIDLSGFPTTTWPDNVENPTQDDVYDSSTGNFLENPVAGQVHIWRVSVSYTKTSQISRSAVGIILKIENPNPASTFSEQYIQVTPEALDEGQLVFNAITIADDLSIGGGYEFFLTTDVDKAFPATITSITRISLQN